MKKLLRQCLLFLEKEKTVYLFFNNNYVHTKNSICMRYVCILLIISFFTQPIFAQIQVLKGGNMESKTGWVVYKQGSTTPATYTFNYTAQKPAQGVGGCLQIISTEKNSLLVWQKVAAKAGETYTVDAAIKTSNATNFWAEIYVSTISPIEGVEYLPNNNADVVAGFSTWNRCGSNVNGTFKLNSCTGKKTFVVPGNIGTNVDIYFGCKVGSSAVPFLNPLEVLVDELKLLRTAAIGNLITSTTLGTLQSTSVTIANNIKAAQLKSALSVSAYASYKILNSSNTEVSPLTVLTNTMKIVVTAENGIAKTYTLATTAPAIAIQSLNNYIGTVASYQNKILDITGNSQITITNTESPLKGSMLNLKSDNVWLYFPNIRPSKVNELYCPQIMINGAAALADQNVRVEQYLQGTMVISQGTTYKALKVHTGENLSGTAMQIGNYTYNNTAELGALNNAIKSFTLKKGYMATFAQTDAGQGISKVYIAETNDIVINKLPANLLNQVSFIRVVPWRWTAKKGWTSGPESAKALNCHWQYDWNNEGTSNLDVEYVPMRHNLNWNSYANINNKLKSTHALGFNEPDRPDQANISVEQAIAAWPEMLKSGLRLGSPSPSDASAGLTWLYKFMDKCDSLKYRVDFVTVHWYKGGQTAKQFYDWLKAIHIRTKRTIWITEWNNGANWTCCKPTYAQQAQAVAEMTNMLDTASFVERYSLYEWVQDTRQMFYENPISLTPAGVVYRDNQSPMAFNQNVAYAATIIKKTAENNVETAIENFSELTIYPNPIQANVNIQTKTNLTSISIYTAGGVLIKTIDAGLKNNNSISLAHYPAGLYIIKLCNGKNTWMRKVVKKGNE